MPGIGEERASADDVSHAGRILAITYNENEGVTQYITYTSVMCQRGVNAKA